MNNIIILYNKNNRRIFLYIIIYLIFGHVHEINTADFYPIILLFGIT